MSILMLCLAFSLAAQEKIKIEGVVYNAMSRKPLPNVQVSSVHAPKSAVTDAEGYFSIEVSSKRSILLVSTFGFISQEVVPGKRSRVEVGLLPENAYLEGADYQLMGVQQAIKGRQGTVVSLRKRDLNPGYNTPDEALPGKIAGLRAISKGGMPGEGVALYLRGIRSFVGENSPLIVLDGMPYLPNMEVSPSVNGFSRNIFLPTNLKEVGSITFLKGADAALFGSLGSNGVVLIESENALDMQTKVLFHTTEGVSFINKHLPLLNARENKAYLADIGENKYADPEELLRKLPFLSDDPTNPTNYLYDHDTDWQKEIYSPAIVSENVLQVKGGDAVAKYMFTVGTQQNAGVIENTQLSKYYTRLNANVSFSQRLTAQIGAGLNYNDYKLQEQGMVVKTNPYLTALYQAPFMSVYKQAYNSKGKLVNLPFYNPVHEELQLSNPVAVMNDVSAGSRSYIVNINFGLDYKITPFLNVKGMFGLYYDQNKDDIFIPGKNYHAIAPLRDSAAINTVRSSVSKQLNYYGRLGLHYQKIFKDWHKFQFAVGGQVLTSDKEFDAGEGANTPTDFYTTLDKVTFGRMVSGAQEKWRWMNYYTYIDYAFARQFYLGAGITFDGASSYGNNSGRWFAFPFVKGAWKIKESSWLQKSAWLSELTLRGEFGINGNSRFSSKYSKYSYVSVPYRWTAGLFRDGLPNSKLRPEKVLNSNIGLDFALMGNRISIGVDLYREQSKDIVLANDQPAVFGFTHRYENAAGIGTNGIEVSFRFNLLNKGHWNWMVGGNIAHFKSEIESLGSLDKRTISFSDGTQLLLETGKSPYLFYGKKAEKVFNSSTEVNASGYRMQSGTPFVAGDVKFYDRNGDKYINDEDNMVIGDPTPDFYGGFYTNLTYKKWNLLLNFTYSYGNDIYNAVRRSLGNMKDFSNQDHSVARRWMVEGQQTDIPRASYGDPHGNSRFSSRWIEDGSYLKLKDVTLSFEHNKKAWIFTSLRIYATGENLLTFTRYLGMDPEFSYSYDPQLLGMDLGKMPLAKNVKLGLVLNF